MTASPAVSRKLGSAPARARAAAGAAARAGAPPAARPRRSPRCSPRDRAGPDWRSSSRGRRRRRASRTGRWRRGPRPRSSREFPQAFDRAFSDRFGGRDLLVRFHHGALLRVFGVSSLGTVMRGTDGWFYWLGEDGHSLDRHYRGTLEFPQAYVDDTAAELARRHDWLAARGIAYVVVVVPEKFTIYPEHLPPWIAKSPQTDALRPRARRDRRRRARELRRPAPGVARRQGARARLLPDRFALELQRRRRRLRRDHARRARRAARAARCPTIAPRAAAAVRAGRRLLQRRPDPDARTAVAHPRGRRRAARQGARRRPAAARAASTRTSSRASSTTRATGPGCRAR